MKLIDLVQRSTAWHEWRSEGLGASAAATIMGSSPWETPIQLWKRMMGLEDPIATTPAMQRGIDYEDEAREAFEKEHGKLAPPCCVESSFHSIIRASLDGMTDDGDIVEIKVPGASSFAKIRENGIPENYQAQMQCQMYAAEASRGWFVAYNPETTELYTTLLLRDDAFIEKMVSAMLEFWRMVQDGMPPALTERDYVQITVPIALENEKIWRTAKCDLKLAEHREEVARKYLLESIPQATNCIVGMTQIAAVSRDLYDYKQAALDSGIDLEKYRKKTTYQRFSIKNDH
ncbi:MAG TPA: YqaJ viral recombinase family protein [Patescibacteria group bacterium]|nr:YqaJ viral recombinase family protein [Patescibacteria group bacterium]